MRQAQLNPKLKMKNKISYHSDLMERLKDIRCAGAYLNAALEEDERRVFLLALRDVAEAQGGMTKLSRLTNISREHIYRMLSEKETPNLSPSKHF